MAHTTEFTDPAAVEAWDAWFRWRSDEGLRDRTIDATWWRVAEALATVEGVQAPLWAYRFVEAFSRWRLLPDARILRSAGTGEACDLEDGLSAVLNAAAFVTLPSSPQASLDTQALIATAALAVRMLDDAALALFPDAPVRPEARIGLIGMADALRLLGLAYDSPQARDQARIVAACLAQGALRGSVDLACERGACDTDLEPLRALWQLREMPAALVEDAARCGVRYARLTGIEPHPRLAQLANNASDALDAVPAVPRESQESGRRHEAFLPAASASFPSLTAQVELRAALQPWIDAPIAYPLALLAPTEPTEIEAAMRLADQHGLRLSIYPREGAADAAAPMLEANGQG